MREGNPVNRPRIRRPALSCQQLRLPNLSGGITTQTTVTQRRLVKMACKNDGVQRTTKGLGQDRHTQQRIVFTGGCIYVHACMTMRRVVQAGTPVNRPRTRRPALPCQQLRLPNLPGGIPTQTPATQKNVRWRVRDRGQGVGWGEEGSRLLLLILLLLLLLPPF